MTENRMVTLNQVLELARKLSPVEKVRLIEMVIPDLEIHLNAEVQSRLSLKPAYGLFSDLGTGPSDEDIDDVRQDMQADFPREDL